MQQELIQKIQQIQQNTTENLQNTTQYYKITKIQNATQYCKNTQNTKIQTKE